MTEYYQCNKCNQIEPKENWQRPYLSLLCMHCFRSEKAIWPSTDILDLFEHALNYEESSLHYSLVASVFVSTALELLLERLIFLTALQDLSAEEVDFYINLLLESYQGKSRRLQLFNKLAENSFEVEARVTGNKNFIKHWNNITKARNKLIHGGHQTHMEVTPNQINTIVEESLDVFHKIHNKYNQYTRSYAYYVNENKTTINKPSDKDIFKLNKWLKRWK